jgi:predicted RNase H-like nuclease (RuvC/YqgF family)
MAGICKTVIRLGVIGALVTGGAVVIAGPHRVMALGTQVQSKIVHVIDANIDNPVALRAQLRDLQQQYPKRIAEVRSQLAELVEQVRQVHREKAVSEKVVSMAASDLDDLGTLLARAEEARVEFASDGSYRTVSIAFNDESLSLDQAYSKANYITELVRSYEARTIDASNDLTNLERDQARLTSLLSKLESEQTQFQAQLAQLDRQIDSVARKERMVEVMEDRSERIDELSRYNVASLDQFKSVLAKRQAELESRIASIADRENAIDYEDKASYQIDTQSYTSFSTHTTIRKPSTDGPNVEIRLESNDCDSDAAVTGPVASSR